MIPVEKALEIVLAHTPVLPAEEVSLELAVGRVLAEDVHSDVDMFGLGFPELLLILVIVVIIFGTSRLPELGKGMGEGIRNFKKSIKTEEDQKKPSEHQ